MKRHDTRRIVEQLLEGPETNLRLSFLLWIPNPANRISDARREGAPIKDTWRKSSNGCRYKVYSVNRQKARKWLAK